MPHRLFRHVALPCGALLALAACNDAAPEATDDSARAASGEVLEGSISDAMLPLETLDSQPPVAKPLPGEGMPSGLPLAGEPASPALPDVAEPNAAPEPEPEPETEASE